MAGVNL